MHATTEPASTFLTFVRYRHILFSALYWGGYFHCTLRAIKENSQCLNISKFQHLLLVKSMQMFWTSRRLKNYKLQAAQQIMSCQAARVQK